MGIDREPSNSWDPQGNTAVGICNSTRLPCHHTVAKHIIPWRGPYFLPVPVTTWIRNSAPDTLHEKRHQNYACTSSGESKNAIKTTLRLHKQWGVKKRHQNHSCTSSGESHKAIAREYSSCPIRPQSSILSYIFGSLLNEGTKLLCCVRSRKWLQVRLGAIYIR